LSDYPVVCTIGKNQAVTATIVGLAIGGFFQGSAYLPVQGDVSPIAFGNRSSRRKPDLLFNPLWWTEENSKPDKGSVFAGSRAMLLTQRQSTKDHDAAHRARTECMRRTTDDRHSVCDGHWCLGYSADEEGWMAKADAVSGFGLSCRVKGSSQYSASEIMLGCLLSSKRT
jgi:hypothetical protein